MDYGKAFKQYKRSSIETADKLELVIMCYDQAILLIRQAKENLMNGEIDKKSYKIKKTLNIINELQANLNFEKGGQIAKSLDSLYSYITRRIVLADVEKRYSIFDECIDIMNELKEAWVGISIKKEVPVSPEPVNQEIRRLSQHIAA